MLFRRLLFNEYTGTVAKLACYGFFGYAGYTMFHDDRDRRELNAISDMFFSKPVFHVLYHLERIKDGVSGVVLEHIKETKGKEYDHGALCYYTPRCLCCDDSFVFAVRHS